MSREPSDFIKYCRKASKIVETWPEWKQTLLGTANSSCQDRRKK